MNTIKQTLVRGAMAVITAICGIACVYDNYPEYYDNDYIYGGVDVELSLQMLYGSSTRGAESTRAGLSLPAESVENLRVVIVSLPLKSDGGQVDGSLGEEPFVEINTVMNRVSFDRAGQHLIRFSKIRSDRIKRVFLFANCESEYLNLQIDGEPVDLNDERLYLPTDQYLNPDYKAPVEDCRFSALKGTSAAAYRPGEKPGADGVTPVEDYHIPMTAMHKIAVPTVDYLRDNVTDFSPQLVYHLESPLYLVRAVNKVDIEVINGTGSDSPDSSIQPIQVRLKSFTISQICDGESYLFAHFDSQNDSARAEQEEFFGPYKLPSAADSGKPYYEWKNINPSWMQWLKNESEKEHYPEEGDVEDTVCQWLQSYLLPGDAPAYRNVEWTTAFDENQSKWTAAERGAVSQVMPVYFPETIYNTVDVTTDEGVKTRTKQQYKLQCTFEMREDANDTPMDFETDVVDLPHLESLFRNTHVKIRVTVKDNALVKLELVVMPWTMAPVEEWHYTKTVSVASNGFLKWDSPGNGILYDSQVHKNDNEDEDKSNAYLVLAPDPAECAVGTFTISAPVNDDWYAYLIPITGDPDAFAFVDEDGKEIETPHGKIDGTPASVRVHCRRAVAPEQNTAKLQIMVRTADNRFLEADVCDGEPKYYTIVQNRNKF